MLLIGVEVVLLARRREFGTVPVQLTSVDLCMGTGLQLKIARDGMGAFSCYTAIFVIFADADAASMAFPLVARSAILLLYRTCIHLVQKLYHHWLGQLGTVSVSWPWEFNY